MISSTTFGEPRRHFFGIWNQEKVGITAQISKPSWTSSITHSSSGIFRTPNRISSVQILQTILPWENPEASSSQISLHPFLITILHWENPEVKFFWNPQVGSDRTSFQLSSYIGRTQKSSFFLEFRIQKRGELLPKFRFQFLSILHRSMVRRTQKLFWFSIFFWANILLIQGGPTQYEHSYHQCTLQSIHILERNWYKIAPKSWKTTWEPKSP